jgi:hypothetical protein
MSVGHSVEEKLNGIDPVDVAILNPVVEATEKSWYVLYTPHLQLLRQVGHTAWGRRGERRRRRRARSAWQTAMEEN